MSDGVRLQDKSLIFSDIPGSGIEIKSSSGIFVQSRTVDYNYGTGKDPLNLPDMSILYSGQFGLGKMLLSSPSNIIIINAALGGLSASLSLKDIQLQMRLNSENITLARALILLGGTSDQVNIKKSDISLMTDAVIPLFNVINGKFYTNDGGFSYGVTPRYPKGFGNVIAKVSGAESSFSFSVSGSVFGINGVLPALNPPEFESNKLGNACEAYTKGALTLEGRGQNKVGSAALLN